MALALFRIRDFPIMCSDVLLNPDEIFGKGHFSEFFSNEHRHMISVLFWVVAVIPLQARRHRTLQTYQIESLEILSLRHDSLRKWIHFLKKTLENESTWRYITQGFSVFSVDCFTFCIRCGVLINYNTKFQETKQAMVFSSCRSEDHTPWRTDRTEVRHSQSQSQIIQLFILQTVISATTSL